MYALRKWSVNHAKSFNTTYSVLEKILVILDPVWQKIGYERLEKPITFVEKNIKGFLFDCQMCGQCVLHDTGMSCPMNCPKELRNGPCGGVRPNGHCEVKPEMRCVWVEAWRGSKILNGGTASDSMIDLQPTLDNRLNGQSSWLREVRLKNDPQSIKNQSDVC